MLLMAFGHLLIRSNFNGVYGIGCGHALILWDSGHSF